jgi:hypothetical protein
MNVARIPALCAAPTVGGTAAFLVGSNEDKTSEAPLVPFATPGALIAKSGGGTGIA